MCDRQSSAYSMFSSQCFSVVWTCFKIFLLIFTITLLASFQMECLDDTNTTEVNACLSVPGKGGTGTQALITSQVLWLVPGQSLRKDFKTHPNFIKVKMWKMYILPSSKYTVVFETVCARPLLIKCFTWFNLFNPHNNLVNYCSYAHFINEETEVVRLSNFPKSTELVKLLSQNLRTASMTPNHV